MLVVKMQGRFGNQLFVYAFGLMLEHILGGVVAYDCLSPEEGLSKPWRRLYYWLKNGLGRRGYQIDLPCMGVRLKRASVVGMAVRNFKRVGESEFCGLDVENLRSLSRGHNLYFDGYWQNERFFKDVVLHVRESFRFRRKLPATTSALLERIRGGASVAVHVRRGDYVANPRTAAAHNICDLAYYKAAMEVVRGRVPDAHFYVFSDDIAWCKESLCLNGCRMEFVETGQHGVPHADVELMMNCRHFVIANSSYSWWAAYLGAYPGKVVVAPAVWNRMHLDLRPQCEGWVTLPVT